MSWLAGLINKTHPVYAPGGENKFNQEELASANSSVMVPPPPPFWFVSTRLCICENGSGYWLIIFCPRLISCCSLYCNENYCSWKSCTESFNNQSALDKLLMANIQGAWTWPYRGGPHPREENVFLKCVGWHTASGVELSQKLQDWGRNRKKSNYFCFEMATIASLVGPLCWLTVIARRWKMPSLLLKTRLEDIFSCVRSVLSFPVYKIGHSGYFRHPLWPFWIQAKSAKLGGWRWRDGSQRWLWMGASPLPTEMGPWTAEASGCACDRAAGVPRSSPSMWKVSTKPSSSKGCGRSAGRLMHSSCQNILPAIHPVNMPSLSFAWKGICYGILIHGLCSRC